MNFSVLSMDSPPQATSSNTSRKRMRPESPLGAEECAVCRRFFENPHSTPCGHIFCKVCIQTAIQEVRHCPTCNKVLNKDTVLKHLPEVAVAANVSRIYYQLKEFVKMRGYELIDCDVSMVLKHFCRVHPAYQGIPMVRAELEQMKEEHTLTRDLENAKLVVDFLETFQQRRKEFAYRCFNESQDAGKDMEDLQESSKILRNSAGGSKPLNEVIDDILYKWIGNATTAEIGAHDLTDSHGLSLPSNKKLKRHMLNLEREYVNMRSKGNRNSNDSDAEEARFRSFRHFKKIIAGVCRYGQFTNIATMDYTRDSYPTSSVVSAIDFDRDSEYFVIAGIGNKLKIYDYDNVIERPNNPFPVAVLQTSSKVSNVSWNPYAKSILASSNYGGSVQVWDASLAKCLHTFTEHEKRCWSVQFNNIDPNVMASGSDDMKVKLWNLTCGDSIATIDTRVQVCCVHFNPTKQHQLVFGGSDHSVYVFDIRFLRSAQNIMRGHRKAVSYVKYLDTDHVVTASTDSTCKIWDIRTGLCTNTMEGHLNEKNFVGLATMGDHIICGSETNEVYAYYRHITKPVCKYDFDPETMDDFSGFTLPRPYNDNSSDFVSALCWKRNSNIVMAANSLGRAYILQLTD